MSSDQGEECAQNNFAEPNQNPFDDFSHSPSQSDADLLELDLDKIDDSKPFQDNDWNDVDKAPHTSIKVMCRIRPRLSNKGTDCVDPPPSIFKTIERSYVEMIPPFEKNGIATFRSSNRNTKSPRQFQMDHVFSESTNQTEVFTRVGLPCLESVFQGINSTILAYGQTGSGKTYTLLGGAESLNLSPSHGLDPTTDSIPSYCGLIPRSILHCFFKVEELSTNYDFTITLSIIEIYNEVINDLITGKGNLKSYHTFIPKSLNPQFQPFNDCKSTKPPSCDRFYIKDLSEHIVGSPEEAYKLLNQALNNRKIAYTKSNAESSRSHLIFMLEVKQVNKIDGTRKTSTMYIVDLAGSEKAETSTSNINLQEGKMINKSLSCLSKVVHLLSIMASDKNKLISHIPYRDSKLTQILKNSLGGDSKTYFILNCSMDFSNYNESLFTLRFGQRAKHVKNVPLVNSEATTLSMQSQLKLYQNLLHQIIEWGLIIFLHSSGSIDMKFEQSQNINPNYTRSKQMSLLPSYMPSKDTFTSYSYTPQTSSKDPESQFFEVFVNRENWEAFWNSLPAPPDPTFDYIFDEIRSKLIISEPNSRNLTVKVRIRDQNFENFKNNAYKFFQVFTDSNPKNHALNFSFLKERYFLHNSYSVLPSNEDQALNGFSYIFDETFRNNLDLKLIKNSSSKGSTGNFNFAKDGKEFNLSEVVEASIEKQSSEPTFKNFSQDSFTDKENVKYNLQLKPFEAKDGLLPTTSIIQQSCELQALSETEKPSDKTEQPSETEKPSDKTEQPSETEQPSDTEQLSDSGQLSEKPSNNVLSSDRKQVPEQPSDTKQLSDKKHTSNLSSQKFIANNNNTLLFPQDKRHEIIKQETTDKPYLYSDITFKNSEIILRSNETDNTINNDNNTTKLEENETENNPNAIGTLKEGFDCYQDNYLELTNTPLLGNFLNTISNENDFNSTFLSKFEDTNNSTKENPAHEFVVEKRSTWFNILYKCYTGIVSILRYIVIPRRASNLLGMEKLKFQHNLLSEYSCYLSEKPHFNQKSIYTSSIPDQSIHEILSVTIKHNIELLQILETCHSTSK